MAPIHTAVPQSVQNLHKIKCVRNPKYQASGRKSLGHLVRKYEITPTLPCPFTVIHDLVDETSKQFLKNVDDASKQLLKTIKPTKKNETHNSHSHTVARMVKRDATGKAGHVGAEDVQNDSEYLAQSTLLPKDVQAQGGQNGHSIYDPSKSSTWKGVSGQTWQIQYGDGSTASGTCGTDNVTVGGLCVETQTVELAKSIADSFQQTKGDGLLGLAFGTINTVRPHPVHTPVENMITQSDIPSDNSLFTAYLTNSKDNVDPCYTFGYIDQDLVNGGFINYAPIDASQGFWQVKSTSMMIGNQKYPLAGNTAIMDTGTTLSLIDDTSCKNIYAAIPGATYSQDQAGYIFPSSTPLDQLPTISFAIGDAQMTIHKQDLGFADVGNGMTYGGIQSRGNMNFSIYGGTHLKGVYAIFDQGKKQFGFVQKPDTSNNAAGGQGSGTQRNVRTDWRPATAPSDAPVPVVKKSNTAPHP